MIKLSVAGTLTFGWRRSHLFIIDFFFEHLLISEKMWSKWKNKSSWRVRMSISKMATPHFSIISSRHRPTTCQGLAREQWRLKLSNPQISRTQTKENTVQTRGYLSWANPEEALWNRLRQHLSSTPRVDMCWHCPQSHPPENKTSLVERRLGLKPALEHAPIKGDSHSASSAIFRPKFVSLDQNCLANMSAQWQCQTQ